MADEKDKPPHPPHPPHPPKPPGPPNPPGPPKLQVHAETVVGARDGASRFRVGGTFASCSRIRSASVISGNQASDRRPSRHKFLPNGF